MAHSPQMRAKARVLFEKGLSLRDIAESLDLDHKSVLAWSKKEAWVKGKLVPALEQKERDAALSEAEKLGLTKAYFYGKVKQLCEATRPVLVKGDKAEQEEAKAEGDESGGAFVQDIPDFKAIDAGLTHAERMIPGIKVAEKIEDDRFSGVLEWIRRQ